MLKNETFEVVQLVICLATGYLRWEIRKEFGSVEISELRGEGSEFLFE